MPRRRRSSSDPRFIVFSALIVLAVLGLMNSTPTLVLPVIVAGVLYIAFLRKQQQVRRARTLALSDLHALSHRELELHVAAVLDALPGWSARATRGSSDQGADVIATSPSNVVVAVQVKHYPKNNVGNKAVQEIVASKAIYQATQAVVFTSGPGYTASARELARANGVRLWTPADLFALQAAAQTGGEVKSGLLPA